MERYVLAPDEEVSMTLETKDSYSSLLPPVYLESGVVTLIKTSTFAVCKREKR